MIITWSLGLIFRSKCIRLNIRYCWRNGDSEGIRSGINISVDEMFIIRTVSPFIFLDLWTAILWIYNINDILIFINIDFDDLRTIALNVIKQYFLKNWHLRFMIFLCTNFCQIWITRFYSFKIILSIYQSHRTMFHISYSRIFYNLIYIIERILFTADKIYSMHIAFPKDYYISDKISQSPLFLYHFVFYITIF